MTKDTVTAILLLAALSGCAGSAPRICEAVPPPGAAQQEAPAVVLSPDGKLEAFVRSTPDVLVETGMGKEEATEIWTARPDGGDARMRLRGHSGATPENTLAGFSDLQFSPDGRRLFFLSAAWVTSGAVHVLDLDAGTERYLCPGNSVEVIPRGEYVGHLMVSQHRYLIAGGSYDWLWLLTPEGKAVGPIAMDDDDGATQRFRELYVK